MNGASAEPPRTDEELILAVRGGDRESFGVLVERWFDRCWEIAWRILRDRELAADVAQDTLLTAWQQLDRLEQTASFGGWVSRIARNRALDRLEQERRAVPTADEQALEPRWEEAAVHTATDPAAAFGRAERRDLVWAAAAALGERDMSLLDLHLRHGLEPHELAVELDIAPNAAHQALFRLRKRLGSAIRAWLLWREDTPTCVVLRAELAAAGISSFGADAVRAVETHVRSCATCAEEHERVAAPAALFSAVPLLAVPAALRSGAFAELAAAGVPVRHEGVAFDGTTEAPAGPEPSMGWGHPSAGPEAAPGVETSGPGDPAAEPAGTPPPAQGSAGTTSALVGGLVAALLIVLGLWSWWGGELQLDPGTAVAAADEAGGAEAAAGPSDDPGGLRIEGHPAGAGGELTAPPPDQGADAAPADGADELAPPVVDEPEDRPRRPAGTSDPAGDPGAEPPPSSPPPSSPPPPSPPEIVAFDAVVVGDCGGAELLHELTWRTRDAESASLRVGSGERGPVPVSGTAHRCAPNGTPFTLTATGPGGTVEATRDATLVPQ